MEPNVKRRRSSGQGVGGVWVELAADETAAADIGLLTSGGWKPVSGALWPSESTPRHPDRDWDFVRMAQRASGWASVASLQCHPPVLYGPTTRPSKAFQVASMYMAFDIGEERGSSIRPAGEQVDGASAPQ